MTENTNSSSTIKFSLNHSDISPDAMQIVQALQKKGFTTYLVGGCVRDLLLKRHPKDFDIATNAHPREVKRVIANSFIIGKRFRLVLVKRGLEQYEVSTFRRDPTPEELSSEDTPVGDNIFGSPEEDARRRDFTVNALFYDPTQKAILDFAGGLPDLQIGMVKMIGDPNIRLLEDPIRIMRGIRLAHMIRFSLDSDLRTAIQKHSSCLKLTALPRRREEILKYLRLDNPALPFLTSLDLGALDFVSPTLSKILRDTAKNEMFLAHLFSFHDKKLESPLELFSGLVMAYFLTMNNGELPCNVRTNDILENESYLKFMRDELGMFKHEQASVAKALHLMTLFLKRNEFENRGERRRVALLANEAFPLSLKLAEREHWLSATDLHFWTTEYKKFSDNSEPRPSSPRRRRPLQSKKTRQSQ